MRLRMSEAEWAMEHPRSLDPQLRISSLRAWIPLRGEATLRLVDPPNLAASLVWLQIPADLILAFLHNDRTGAPAGKNDLAASEATVAMMRANVCDVV